MDTIKIPEGVQVKLKVEVSSDSPAGTAVSLNDVVIKRSGLSQFVLGLGTIQTLNDNGMSIVTSFTIQPNILDQVMAATQVTCTITYGTENHVFPAEKLKISNNFFIAYVYVEFTK